MKKRKTGAAQSRAQQLKLALSLGFYFFKIGWFTFGGGWSIIAQVQRDYVEKKQLITDEELMDMTSIGRSLPGIMVTNVSFIFGYHLAGVPGAVLSIIGMVIPSLLVLCVVTGFYAQFRSNVYVVRAMTGVRAAVVPIMLHAGYKLRKSSLQDNYNKLIMLVVLALCLFTNLNKIMIIIAGALIGLVIREVRRHGSA